MADISLDEYIGFTGTTAGRGISSRLGAKNVRGRGRGRGGQQVRSPQATKFNVTGVGKVAGKSSGFDARQKLTSNAAPSAKVNVGDARQKIIQNTKFVDARVRIENKKAQGKPFDARNKISAKPVADARSKIKAKQVNAAQTPQQTAQAGKFSQITVTQQGRVLTQQGGGVVAGSGGQLIKTITSPNQSSGFMGNNANGYQKTIHNSAAGSVTSQGRGQLIKTVRNNDVGGIIAGQLIRKAVQDNYADAPYRRQSASSDLVITTTNRQTVNQAGNIIHLNSKGGRLKPPPGSSASAMASERPEPMSAMSRLGIPQQRKPVTSLAQRLKPAPSMRTGSQQLRLSMNTQSRLGSQPTERVSRPLSAQVVRQAVTAPSYMQRQRSAPSQSISMSAAVAKDLEYYEQEYYEEERMTYEEQEEEPLYATPPPRRVPTQPRVRPQPPAPQEDAFVPTEDIVSPLQGYRIYITNLHPIVTQDDVVELFGSLGPLKKARLLKVGTAEVVYVHREDAVTAQRKYHLRELDGQPMEVRLMTRGPAPQPQAAPKPAPPPARYTPPESPAEPMAGPLRLGGQSRLPSPPPQPRKPVSQMEKSGSAVSGGGIDPSLIHRALFKSQSKDEETPHRPVSFVVKI